MRLTLQSAVLLTSVLVVGLVCMNSCRFKGEDKEEAKPAANDLTSCERGGGRYEGSTCVCGQDEKWNGKECEATSQEVVVSKTDEKKTCVSSDGQWTVNERCLCRKGSSLVEGRCQQDTPAPQETCEGSGGVWNGVCECSEGKVARDSECISDETKSGLVLQQACLSQSGKWDDREMRCHCPVARVWHQGKCLVQSTLKSREVCGTDFNRGVWNAKKKLCTCRVGEMWISQSCRPIWSVPERQACSSELNSGKWDAKSRKCTCPSNAGWISALKICGSKGFSSAQLVCLQSGGMPINRPIKCYCPKGLKTVKRQGLAFCARTDVADFKLPGWFTRLLGL